eukprot:jgi/Botrbrau1/11964/Bobra.341_1s0029.1
MEDSRVCLRIGLVMVGHRELVTGETPRRGCMRAPRVPEECNQDVADLIDKCCTPNPAERPTAQDLMAFLARHSGSHPEELECLLWR